MKGDREPLVVEILFRVHRQDSVAFQHCTRPSNKRSTRGSERRTPSTLFRGRGPDVFVHLSTIFVHGKHKESCETYLLIFSLERCLLTMRIRNGGEAPDIERRERGNSFSRIDFLFLTYSEDQLFRIECVAHPSAAFFTFPNSYADWPEKNPENLRSRNGYWPESVY